MADGFPVDIAHAPVEIVTKGDGLDMEVSQIAIEVLHGQDGFDMEVSQVAVEVLRELNIIILAKRSTKVNIIM